MSSFSKKTYYFNPFCSFLLFLPKFSVSFEGVGHRIKSSSDIWKFFDRLIVQQHPHLTELRNVDDVYRWVDDPIRASMFNGKDVVFVIDDVQEILGSPLPDVSEYFLKVLDSLRGLKITALGERDYCKLRSIILLTDQHMPSLPFVSIEVPTLTPNLIVDLLKHVETSPPIEFNNAATVSELKCVADDIFARTFGHPGHVAFCVSAMHKTFSDPGMFLEHSNGTDEIDKSIIQASWTELWSGELLQLMMRSCSSVHRLIDEIPRDATSRELQIQFIASANALIVPDGHVQRSNVDFLVALGALRKIAPSEFAISSPFVRSVLLREAAKKKEQSPKTKLCTRSHLSFLLTLFMD